MFAVIFRVHAAKVAAPKPAEVGHCRCADLQFVLLLRQERQRTSVDDAFMAGISPCPHALVTWAGGEQMPAILQCPPYLVEVREERSVIALRAQMLQHLIGVDLIECVVIHRPRRFVEVMDDVRTAVRIMVYRDQFFPRQLAEAQLLDPTVPAADQ